MKNKALVQQADLLELVFAGRNRNYGAYLLRRSYPQYLARALGIGFLLISSFFGFIHLITAAEKAGHKTADPNIVLSRGVLPKPKISTPLPTPPQMTAQTQMARSSIRFVPPVVVQDEVVPDDRAAHTQAELAITELEIGGRDRTGDTGAPPGLPNLEIMNTSSGTGVLEHPVPKVYEPTDVQKMPSFPGGEGELLRYLAREIRYPVMAREAGVEGPVVLSFVVNTDGSIGNITVLKDPGAGCAKEAVRVLSTMPRWMPGEANGHLVKVRFYLPVRFELN